MNNSYSFLMERENKLKQENKNYHKKINLKAKCIDIKNLR